VVLAVAGPAFLPATTAWSGDPEVADISEALTQAVTALRSVPADDALGLTRAIGVARVRVLLLEGNRQAAGQAATALVYRFRDQALMSVAFAQVAAGDVDAALATAALVGGAYRLEAPIAYVAWAVAKQGDTTRALEIAQGLQRDDNRVLALGDIAVTQAESGDMAGATATAEVLTSPVERAVALADIALVQFRAGDRATATAALGRADAIVRNAPPSPARNYALLVTAEVHAQFQDFAGALALASSRETSSTQKSIRWNLSMAQAVAGDVPGALKADSSIKRDGNLAASLAEGGHLDAARKALNEVRDDQDRIEALRHVAVVLAKRQERNESAQLFQSARRIATSLRDPGWRACRLRKVAVSQAEVTFDAEALDTATTIGLDSERTRAFREIARAQAVNGRFAAAVTWAMAQTGPLTRAGALLGAAEGALQAAGYADVHAIKVNRYRRRSSVYINVAC